MAKAEIVFATITGNNEDIADIIAENLEDQGLDVQVDEISQAEYDLELESIRADTTKDGLTADSFQNLQESLSEKLDELDPIAQNYYLEVSQSRPHLKIA